MKIKWINENFKIFRGSTLHQGWDGLRKKSGRVSGRQPVPSLPFTNSVPKLGVTIYESLEAA